MRLIDADKLLDTVKNDYELKQRADTDEALHTSVRIVDRYVFRRVKRWIEAAPTVENVAPVVRCKECKHYYRKEEECLLIKGQFGEDILGGHEASDFCSKIERRENEETD